MTLPDKPPVKRRAYTTDLGLLGVGYANDECGSVSCLGTWTQVRVDPTPLPSSWVLLLGGLAGLGFVAYRGSKRSLPTIATA
jgi:hypothetical protein